MMGICLPATGTMSARVLNFRSELEDVDDIQCTTLEG